MNENHKHFILHSEKVAFDTVHRNKIKFNISKYDQAVVRGKTQYSNLELAKQRAAFIKHRSLEELDKYLIEFERNFEKNGGKVIWAKYAKDAVKEILKIAENHNTKLVVKSKTMISEEIEINEAFENQKIESLETDLGEFIVQLAGEKPYHIVTPAMHKSKEDVALLFHEKFNLDPASTPEEITGFVRNYLRDKFQKAHIGITGANFLIADTGSVALTENEGNGMMSYSFPKVHIAIAGIEKIIPSLADLDLFWPLLATHGTGQNITVYNSILSGPQKNDETDGPEEMYVVLLDNRRTEILKNYEIRRALSCIRCGACLNSCPVYKNIGGYTYNTTYSGPIGSVISPYLRDFSDYNHLSFASSLCGKCTEVCPVKINLHELLLINRKNAVKWGYTGRKDRLTIKGWKLLMQKRNRLDSISHSLKNAGLKMALKKTWGAHRTLPSIAKESFKQLWMEKHPDNSKTSV